MTEAERALLLAVAHRTAMLLDSCVYYEAARDMRNLIAAVEAEADFKRAGAAAVDFLDENPTLLSEVGALLDGKSCGSNPSKKEKVNDHT